MSEEVEETTQSEPEAKGLRAQLETALSENKDLKAKDRDRAFTDAGLDITKGVGKAVYKEYDGDMTKDAILGYATEEYSYEAGEGVVHPQAEAIAQGQAALDQVGQTAGSVVPPTQSDELAKAEAEGDYATTLAIKGQRVADSLFGR